MEKNKLYQFVLLLSLVGILWVILHRIGFSWIPVGCLFHKITGIPCPACGSTRAVLAFLQGNFLEAILINPFGIFTSFLSIILPGWVCIDILTKKDSFYLFYKKSERIICRKEVASFLVILVIVNWLWNISKNL